MPAVGAETVWEHTLELAAILFVTLAFVTSLILLVRILRIRHPKFNRLNSKINRRARLEVFLAYSPWGEVIEVCQAVSSIFSVALYIYGTYLENGKAPLWYSWLDLILCFYFTFHWALDYYLSKNRLKYLYSFYSIVDLATVLPIYDNVVRGKFFDELDTFQFLRVLRVIRILRINRLLHNFKNEVTRQLFKSAISIFTIIFLISGFWMNIEWNSLYADNRPLQFHETVYFLVVTVTTVGYGDLHPTSALGQITITLVISLGAVVLIPYHVSKLMETINNYSPYKLDLSKSSMQGHVVLLAEEMIANSLLEFLLEFYHERYGKMRKEVVILCPKQPSEKMKALLHHAFYKHRVFYLMGDPTSESDLFRTGFNRADACFLFRPTSWNTSDTHSLLSIIALKNLRKSLLVYPQLVRPDSKLKLPPNVKNFICLEEFSYGDVINSLFEGTSAVVVGLEVVQIDSSKLSKSTHIWLFPPLNTLLTPDMSLIVIAHSIHAPNVRVDTPSIVRQGSMVDAESAENGLLTSMYQMIFV